MTLRRRLSALLACASALMAVLVVPRPAPGAAADIRDQYFNYGTLPATVTQQDLTGCRFQDGSPYVPQWANDCFRTEYFGMKLEVPSTVQEGETVVIRSSVPGHNGSVRFVKIVDEDGPPLQSAVADVEICDPGCLDFGAPAAVVEARPGMKLVAPGCVVSGNTTECHVKFFRGGLPDGAWFRVRQMARTVGCRAFQPGSTDLLVLCLSQDVGIGRSLQYVSVPVYITGDADPDAPEPEFTATELAERGTFNFVSSATDPQGQALDQEWFFGDGESDIGPSVTHTYAKPGRYDVRLQVRDTDGNTASVTHSVPVAAPELEVAIGLPDKEGQTFAPGEQTRVRITVSASEGLGDLTDLTFEGDPLRFDPVDDFDIVSGPVLGPNALDPFTLEPATSRTFDYVVKAGDAVGNVTFRSSVAGDDAADRDVNADGELTVGIREPLLEVTVTAKLADDAGGTSNPLQFELDETDEGPTPREIVVNVRVKNVSDDDVEDISLPEELELSSRGAVAPEPYPMVQLAAPEDLDIGTLEPDEQVQEQYRFEVRDDGKLKATARVQFENPSGGPPATLLQSGAVDIDVGPGALLYFEADVHGAPERNTGETFRIVGKVENRSTTQTITLDPLFAELAQNAGGGSMVQEGLPRPECPCALPLAAEIEPGEEITFHVDVSTMVSRGTRAVVSFAPTGMVENEDGSTSELDADEIYVKDGKEADEGTREISVSLLDGVPMPDGGNPVTWVLNFALGAANSVKAIGEGLVFLLDEWPRLLAEGVLHLPDAVSGLGRLLRAALVTMEYMASGIWSIGLNADEKAAYSREVASYFDEAMLIELGLTPDALAFKMSDFVDKLLIPSQNLLQTGDYDGFSRSMGQLVADVAGPDKVLKIFKAAFRVGGCLLAGASARVRGVMQLAEYLPKGPPGLKNLAQDLRELKVGQELGMATMRKAYGVGEVMAQRIANFARENDLIISLRFRQPRSLYWLEPPNNAVLKPEAIKIKNVDAVDIQFLGYRENDLASVIFKEPIDSAKFEARIAGQPDEVQAIARSRYQTRVDEWNGKFGKDMRAYETAGQVDVGFNYIGNGIGTDVRQGAVKYRKFEMRTVAADDGTAMKVIFMEDDAGVMRRMTGDVDLVDVRKSNGMPLVAAERASFYDAIQDVLGLQHPETPTWVKDGDFLFEKKAELLADHTAAGLAEPVAQIGPDGIWRAVLIDPALSYFDANGFLAYIWWQGGYRTIDSSAYSIGARFAQGVTDAIDSFVNKPFVSPTDWKPKAPVKAVVSRTSNATIAGILAASSKVTTSSASLAIPGLGGCTWRFVDDADALVLSLNRSNEMELWDGAGWLSAGSIVQSCLAGNRRTLNLLPQSGIAVDAHAGNTTITVTALADFAPGAQMDWFTPGQTLLVDPGGDAQEQAMVVSVNGAVITLAGPLQHDHAVSALVVAITTSRGELPATGGGGLPLGALGLLIMLLGFACVGAARPRRVVAR